MDEELEKAFKSCQGKLWALPKEYKKWKDSLYDYRQEWDFLYNEDLKYDIAQRCMACDYLLSLYLWLKPTLIFEENHKFIIIFLLCSIYEGILKDIFTKEKQKSQFIKELIDEKRIRFTDLLGATNKSRIIDQEWGEYLEKLNEARNFVHLSTNKKGKLPEFLGKEPQLLLEELNSFRQYIEKKYKEKDLPF